MKVIKVLPSGFASNSYILTEDGKNAVVIDPAQPTVADVLARNGLQCKFVLLTHGHFDHVGGCAALQSLGAKIFCGEKEKGLIFDSRYLNMFSGIEFAEFDIDGTAADGDEFNMCGITFKVIETAGHSAGSVCYVTDGSIFSGDTLFYGSVGRSDLPTGNPFELVKSVKKLYNLEGDYKVYCGHGEDTTLERERKFNSYVRGR